MLTNGFCLQSFLGNKRQFFFRFFRFFFVFFVFPGFIVWNDVSICVHLGGIRFVRFVYRFYRFVYRFYRFVYRFYRFVYRFQSNEGFVCILLFFAFANVSFAISFDSLDPFFFAKIVITLEFLEMVFDSFGDAVLFNL